MSDNISGTRYALNNGVGSVPALGFGTMFPDPAVARQAVQSALATGYRLLDCAPQYGTETQVGEAMKMVFSFGKVKREDVVVSTKLWNTNHRPDRVKAAFDASRKRLGVDKIDLFLIHTPFAFPPEDESPSGAVDGTASFDFDVTLLETWAAMESLVDEGICGALGLANAGLDKIGMVYESARIKPAVVQVEAHPYLPQDGTLAYCKQRAIVMQASSPFGHGLEPRLLNDPIIYGVAQKAGKTIAQLLLAWALERGAAPLPMSSSPEHMRENLDLAPLSPENAAYLKMSITIRHRFNTAVENGVLAFAAKE